MIKTVTGVKTKLSFARDMGYKYCKVAVDGNNISIHRGYEYTVDEGIEITVPSNDDFQSHYFGISERTEEDKLSRLRDLAIHQSVEHRLKEIVARHETEENYDDNIVGYQPPKDEKKKESLLTRIKSWLKGDVRYKKSGTHG